MLTLRRQKLKTIPMVMMHGDFKETCDVERIYQRANFLAIESDNLERKKKSFFVVSTRQKLTLY